MTCAEWFEATKAKIEENKEGLAGVSATFHFDFSGDGQGLWHIVLPGDGTVDIGEGACPEAQCQFITKWSVMANVVAGKVNPNVAILTGKIKLKGDLNKAMQLAKIAGL